MDDAELYEVGNMQQKRDATRYLEEYSSKFTWKKDHGRVLDIGCGDGGVTTNILRKYIPTHCELIGCDVSENMIHFAEKNHKNERTSFMLLDIQGDLPERFKGYFDHVFSFYALHWATDEKRTFENIYGLMSNGGECFMIYVADAQIFDVYRILVNNEKWGPWMQNMDRYIPKYSHTKEPQKQVKSLMEKIGFLNIDVKFEELVIIYDNMNAAKRALRAICPFKIPNDLYNNFLDDYVEAAKELGASYKKDDEANHEPARGLKKILSSHSCSIEVYLFIKNNIRSDISLPSPKPEQARVSDPVTPLDVLTVKIFNLRLADEDPKHFAIKVTFCDQLILTGIIKSIGARDIVEERTIVRGNMSYDPSDYEKMCFLADNPLVVHIQPLRSVETNVSTQSVKSPKQSFSRGVFANRSSLFTKAAEEISCCNVDILNIFLGVSDKDKMCVRRRMQPMVSPPLLFRKSWDNLPLLTMEVSVNRDTQNARHHNILKDANWMRLTLVAGYNLIAPYNDEYLYTAASRAPLYNDANFSVVTFNQGYRMPSRFKSTSFYPKWESLRVGDDVFSLGDEKFVCQHDDVQNEDNINLTHYLEQTPHYYTTVWGSFHRTLMLDNADHWFWEYVRRYQWPLELHIYGESEGYSFMGFMNLFHLLYPGEDTVRLAVPLKWVNAEDMMRKCGCDLLLTPNDKMPSIPTMKNSRLTTDSGRTMGSSDTVVPRPTGADDKSAFVLVEVKLRRPMRKIVIPPYVNKQEISEMLTDMEQQVPIKRQCTGRGQLDRDWESTIRNAAKSLRRVPYHGMTDFCTLNRQLSETRTRVELFTSCWQEAAIYVNNNFIVEHYLHSNDMFEEMLMMAHACLMKTANNTLIGVESLKDVDPILKAARQARQLQDTLHAMDLYMQVVLKSPRDSNNWRELSTCLKDIDRDWADVCINKSIILDPRHTLTLISKGSIVFEENPAAAEPFFIALLAFNPFWSTVWVIVSAYYAEREMFNMADQIMEYVKWCHSDVVNENTGCPRTWERELGDWWDTTPLLPGTSPYYDAADLLLRLRAMPLAEICMARALSEEGESAAYYHLVALCCRLRGDIEGALCHIRTGLEKYGEISYLRSLEAECYHKLNDTPSAMAAFEKAGTCLGAYNTLLSLPTREPQAARSILVDLVRRQPSAYAWVALADDWMTRAEVCEGGDGDNTEERVAARTSAAASAVQALKWDRRAGRAWALLAKLVKPSARRLFSKNMATVCGYKPQESEESELPSKQSLCHRLGTALRECRCHMCKHLHV